MIWARDSNGNRPGREFFAGLGESDQAKVLALFKRVADFGNQANLNREKFKKVRKLRGHNLFELKSFQIRFIGEFRPNGIFAIAVGLRKKGDNLPESSIESAARILEEYEGGEN